MHEAFYGIRTENFVHAQTVCTRPLHGGGMGLGTRLVMYENALEQGGKEVGGLYVGLSEATSSTVYSLPPPVLLVCLFCTSLSLK